MIVDDKSQPLYYKLKQILTSKIKNNEYQPNAKLPSEQELMQLYNVSRITARRAVQELVDEGIVKRIHGKGTYVAIPDQRRSSLSLDGYRDSLAPSIKARAQIIHCDYSLPTEQVINQLDIDKEEQVLVLKRLWRDQDVPINYDTSYYVAKLCPGLKELVTETTSTFQIMRDKYALDIQRVSREIRIVIAGIHEADLFDCSVGDPLYEINKTCYAKDSLPIHHSHTLVHGYRMTLTVTNDKGNDGGFPLKQ